MKYVVRSLLFVIAITGCGEKSTPGPKVVPSVKGDVYDVTTCEKELKLGEETDSSQLIDKIQIYKKAHKIYLYKNGKKVETFGISLGKHSLEGDKKKEGDMRTPIGKYKIVRKRCDEKHSRYLLISYPNAEDRAEARKNSLNPGGGISIHGQPVWNADGHGDDYTLKHDWTEGCIAVTNTALDRLWRSVELGVPIEIYP